MGKEKSLPNTSAEVPVRRQCVHEASWPLQWSSVTAKAVEAKGENRPWQLQAEWLLGWGSLSAVAKALWALTLVASS